MPEHRQRGESAGRGRSRRQAELMLQSEALPAPLPDPPPIAQDSEKGAVPETGQGRVVRDLRAVVHMSPCRGRLNADRRHHNRIEADVVLRSPEDWSAGPQIRGRVKRELELPMQGVIPATQVVKRCRRELLEATGRTGAIPSEADGGRANTKRSMVGVRMPLGRHRPLPRRSGRDRCTVQGGSLPPLPAGDGIHRERRDLDGVAPRKKLIPETPLKSVTRGEKIEVEVPEEECRMNEFDERN